MEKVIAGLKWFATFLERRFPPKFVASDYVTKAEYDMAIKNHNATITVLVTDFEKLKEQIQTISLRVGLARPMQTVLQKRS